MTPEQFAYWLQGYFEISRNTQLNEEQVKIVKDHLQLCFNKVTPPYHFSSTAGKISTINGISCALPVNFHNDGPRIGF